MYQPHKQYQQQINSNLRSKLAKQALSPPTKKATLQLDRRLATTTALVAATLSAAITTVAA
ncbi:4831_t:CDS:1 [Ambispora leptoticha]|uniref:4831_t:CDS:1 n=1 Tax=Ambispora leptoticha TaxID=144679 RepID=A0A9N9E5P1_9GLOM|nr:4831_t:CDS:1 [Ambispora leptoticha]